MSAVYTAQRIGGSPAFAVLYATAVVVTPDATTTSSTASTANVTISSAPSSVTATPAATTTSSVAGVASVTVADSSAAPTRSPHDLPLWPPRRPIGNILKPND